MKDNCTKSTKPVGFLSYRTRIVSSKVLTGKRNSYTWLAVESVQAKLGKKAYPGPVQQDFEWGGLKREPDFFGGGGIRVLVTLRYWKVDLK